MSVFLTFRIGQTSVQMCRRIMGKLSLFCSTRDVYSDRAAFDHHPTSKHKEQSPFPDQIKGMWFCLKNAFFKVRTGRMPYQYPLKGACSLQKPGQKTCMQVKEKGEKKVGQKFDEKLHDSFLAFHKFTFDRVLATEDNM